MRKRIFVMQVDSGLMEPLSFALKCQLFKR